MSDANDLKVKSEILPFFEKDTNSKPLLNDKNVVSKFTFKIPNLDGKYHEATPTKDEDGDYVLERKSFGNLKEKVIFLEHSVSTEINLVGLQIWRAALLLADFVIHSHELFKDKTILELGSGVGLTSIVAGMFAKKIICTDLNTGDILKLIKTNLERNKNIVKAEIGVFELDFFNRDWSSELRNELEKVDIVLAADVIYDNDVTEAFVETIIKLLSIPLKKTLYLALEKRYVFTISDLDSVAPCYEHLITCLSSAKSKPPFSQWSLCEVPLDFPQYFNYERVRQLVMYKIKT